MPRVWRAPRASGGWPTLSSAFSDGFLGRLPSPELSKPHDDRAKKVLVASTDTESLDRALTLVVTEAAVVLMELRAGAVLRGDRRLVQRLETAFERAVRILTPP